jgi:hypothetical protein
VTLEERTLASARLALTLVAALGVWGSPGVARAVERRAASAPVADGRVEPLLVWHAPAGCSTAAAVQERVRELSGEPELDSSGVRRVEGRVSETTSGWQLELTLVDGVGERKRRLTSQYCEDLAEAAAVAITLAFEAARSREQASLKAPPGGDGLSDGLRRDETGSSAASPGSVVNAGGSTDASSAPDTSSSEANAGSGERPLRPGSAVWLGAELLLDVSSLPAPAPGPSLLGALRWESLRLGAFVAWLPESEKSVGPGQSVAFSVLLGGVRGCYTLGQGLVETALCAGLELGRLSARGPGLLRARRADDPWLAPQLGLELSLPVSQLVMLHARGDAIAPMLRQGYAVNDSQDVHHIGSVGVRIGLGMFVGF